MINFSRLNKVLSLYSLDMRLLLRTSWQLIDDVFQEFILHAEQNHALHLHKLLIHITASLLSRVSCNVRHQLNEELIEVHVKFDSSSFDRFGQLLKLGIPEIHISNLEIIFYFDILYILLAKVLGYILVHLIKELLIELRRELTNIFYDFIVNLFTDLNELVISLILK